MEGLFRTYPIPLIMNMVPISRLSYMGYLFFRAVFISRGKGLT